MTKLPKFLEKLLSKATAEQIARLIQAQPPATTEEEGDANHAAVKAGALAFVEELDDKVILIPYAGPILAALVDSPAVDQKEEEWVDFAVEMAYRALDSVGATSPTVTDAMTYTPAPPAGQPSTADQFATRAPGDTK